MSWVLAHPVLSFVIQLQTPNSELQTALALLAGTGRRIASPPPNIAHGGWGAQKHERAEGIDLDLWTTALALSDGTTTTLILDVDIQILTNERADQIRAAVSEATGVPVQHIRACATHTHSGPVPYKSWIEQGYDLVGPWFDDLARWSAEAACAALANLQPVDVRVGRGECRINANRRCITPGGERFLGVNPEGTCDHEVIVVRFDALASSAASPQRASKEEGTRSERGWAGSSAPGIEERPIMPRAELAAHLEPFSTPSQDPEAEGLVKNVTCSPHVSRLADSTAGLRAASEGQIKELPSFDPPVATLVHYACHPTIMGPANRLITPDFPGAMKRVVETALGGHCVFLQGAAGNVGPVQGFQGDPKIYHQLGAVLGHEVARVALGLVSIPSAVQFREVIPSGAPLGWYEARFATRAAAPLQVRELAVAVPLRDGLPEKNTAMAKLAEWKDRLSIAREKNDAGAITEAIYMARRADIQLRMADDFGGKRSAPVRTHLITFGDVALVGCNIEPFCEIGLALKQRSPFPVTFLCGYTNGRMAYLPTAEEWAKGGYEVDNSPFGPEAAECLLNEILATLRRLRDTGST